MGQSKYLDKLLQVDSKEFLVILGGRTGMVALVEFSFCAPGPEKNGSYHGEVFPSLTQPGHRVLAVELELGSKNREDGDL